MKKIIILLLIVLFIFLIKTSHAQNQELGLSKMECRKYFTSAGVYNESLGIHSLVCETKVGLEYDCQHWKFNAIINKSECLRKK